MSAIQTSNWQAGFLELVPAVETHAKIRFRKLPIERREDAIQEAIAAACINFQVATAQGRLEFVRPGPLADFAVRHVVTGRHVGGKQDAAQDVISPLAQRRHGFTTIGYDRQSYDRHDEQGGEWAAMVVADRRHSIPETAAFRIDFARWLRTLSRRGRKMIAALIRGEGPTAVAVRFGVSPGRVSQLRRRYEQLWCAFRQQALQDDAA
jgi:hypothetical protein